MRGLSGGAVVAALAVSGCRDSSPRLLSAERPQQAPMSIATVVTKWLPYGKPVPADVVLDAAPEPYNPLKHGPLATLSDADNLLNDPTFKPPSRRPGGGGLDYLPLAALSTATPGSFGIHEFRGWTVSQGRGLWYRADVQRNTTWPAGKTTIIYAPTGYPAGGACIEATIAHYREVVSNPIAHGFGIWDHCQLNTWGFFELMTPTWVSKYVRVIKHADNSGDEEGAYIQLYSAVADALPGTYDCWYGLLFNFNTGTWDWKFGRCGSPGYRSTGWNMWEVYWGNQVQNYVGCPSLPGISAEAISMRLPDGGWYGLTPTFLEQNGQSDGCWLFGPYTLHEGHAPVMWHAHTPGSGQ